MPKLKEFRVGVDVSHGEILTPDDSEYDNFFTMLKSLGGSIVVLDSGHLNWEMVKNLSILILGCPVNHYFQSGEITVLVNFVLSGGGLLVFSEYGGDAIQKTNINDITKNFGIYFESTAVRQGYINEVFKSGADESSTIGRNRAVNNFGLQRVSNKTRGIGDIPINDNLKNHSSSLCLITDIMKHEITKNVRKLIFGGICSVRIAKDAVGVCLSDRESWIEIYDELQNQWVRKLENNLPLVALNVYGQGRVVCIGDIDLIGDSGQFGLSALDNRRLIENIINWFLQPVSSETTIDWLLGEIAEHRDDLIWVHESIGNIIESMKLLEERISKIEEVLKSQEDL